MHLTFRIYGVELDLVYVACELVRPFHNPLRPYMQALMSAIPVPDPTVKKKRIVLTGDASSPVNIPLVAIYSRCSLMNK